MKKCTLCANVRTEFVHRNREQVRVCTYADRLQEICRARSLLRPPETEISQILIEAGGLLWRPRFPAGWMLFKTGVLQAGGDVFLQTDTFPSLLLSNIAHSEYISDTSIASSSYGLHCVKDVLLQCPFYEAKLSERWSQHGCISNIQSSFTQPALSAVLCSLHGFYPAAHASSLLSADALLEIFLVSDMLDMKQLHHDAELLMWREFVQKPSSGAWFPSADQALALTCAIPLAHRLQLTLKPLLYCQLLPVSSSTRCWAQIGEDMVDVLSEEHLAELRGELVRHVSAATDNCQIWIAALADVDGQLRSWSRASARGHQFRAHLEASKVDLVTSCPYSRDLLLYSLQWERRGDLHPGSTHHLIQSTTPDDALRLFNECMCAETTSTTPDSIPSNETQNGELFNLVRNRVTQLVPHLMKLKSWKHLIESCRRRILDDAGLVHISSFSTVKGESHAQTKRPPPLVRQNRPVLQTATTSYYNRLVQRPNGRSVGDVPQKKNTQLHIGITEHRTLEAGRVFQATEFNCLSQNLVWK